MFNSKMVFFFLMIFREKKLQNEKIMEIRYIVGTVMFMWMLTFEDLHGHSSTVDVKTKNWNRFQRNKDEQGSKIVLSGEKTLNN